MTALSYISKCQAAYLTSHKENLDETTCIVLADFAENYSMVVQDADQRWYFSEKQCTVHPIVLYYKTSEGKLKTMLLAFFSDDMNHDTENIVSPHFLQITMY